MLAFTRGYSPVSCVQVLAAFLFCVGPFSFCLKTLPGSFLSSHPPDMVSLLLAVLVSFVLPLIPSAFLARGTSSPFAVSLQFYDAPVSWIPLFLLDQPPHIGLSTVLCLFYLATLF